MKALFLINILLSAFTSLAQFDSSISLEDVNIPGDRIIYQVPDSFPYISNCGIQFPGGEKGLWEFISNNLVYPQIARDSSIEGIVVLQFIILSSGKISDIKVLNKPQLGYGLEEAAIDIIKKMPLWVPAMQNGKAVSVPFNIPIRFRLE